MTKKRFSLFHIALALIIVCVLVMSGLLLFMKPGDRHAKKVPSPGSEVKSGTPNPVFRKDGVLTFTDGKSSREIITIAVEVADDEAERTQGLMYRDSLPQFSGMFFLFPVEEPMAFWMKNTRFSLDIIYVDANRRIVDIIENTTPFSEVQLPSKAPAQYVVEVVGGFCREHGIRIGDMIRF